ncbi:MAG TPA: hypothetical protein VLK65_29705 [Vicinamibacteria bacterium]|nr:hypothetical protein [Vicinamibacteria bacterium]
MQLWLASLCFVFLGRASTAQEQRAVSPRPVLRAYRPTHRVPVKLLSVHLEARKITGMDASGRRRSFTVASSAAGKLALARAGDDLVLTVERSGDKAEIKTVVAIDLVHSGPRPKERLP